MCWLEKSLIGLSLLLMSLQAVITRQDMNPDGVSYLDIADHLLNGQFSVLAHPYWSTLYPVLLAPAIGIARTDSIDMFVVVHAVNWLIGVLTLCAFVCLLRELRVRSGGEKSEQDRLHSKSFLLIAYALLTYAILDLIGIGLVTPDLFVCLITVLSAGLFLRMEHRANSNAMGWALFLGWLLGVGYYVKASMLPIGLLFILAILIGAIWKPRRMMIAFAALAAFLTTVAPLVGSISQRVGHFSIGETGRINYLNFVLLEPQFYSWHARTLFSDPLVVDLRDTVPGTSPEHYDPSYFAPATPLKVDAGLQLSAVFLSLSSIFGITANICLIMVFVTVLLSSPQLRKHDGLPLVLTWSIAAVLLYSLVLIENRYIGAFWLLSWLAALMWIRPTKNIEQISRVTCVSAGLVFGLVLTALAQQFYWPGPSSGANSAEVVEQLRGAGIGSGAKLAVLGFPVARPAFVARLGQMRIIATIRERELRRSDQAQAGVSPAERFWKLDDSQLGSLVAALKGAGVDAILALDQPCTKRGPEWIKLGRNTDCVRKL